MIELHQSVTRRVMLKLFETGTTTAATGKTVAVTLSKNGAAFANPSAGSTNATELANGWYYVDLSTTDTNTLGDLVVRGTATGCDATERIFAVVDAVRRGMTSLPNAAAGASGGLPTGDGSGRVLLQPVTHTSAVIPTVSTLTGHTPQTGDAYAVVSNVGYGNSALGTVLSGLQTTIGIPAGTSLADDIADFSDRVGAPVGATLSNDLAAVKSDTGNLVTRLGTPSNLGGGATVAANLADIEAQTDDIGTAGAGLSAIPWNAAWDAEVQSEVADALTAYGVSTFAGGAVASVTGDVGGKVLGGGSGTITGAGVWAFDDGGDPIAGGSGGGATAEEIADAVRTELTTELGRIDATISSRSTFAGGAVASVTAGVNVTLWRGNTPGNLDSNGFLPANVASLNGSTLRAGTLAGWLDAGRVVANTDQIEGSDATNTLDARIDNRLTAFGVSTLNASGVRDAVGLAAANLDTQLADIPTVGEFNARTIASASYATASAITAVSDAIAAGVTIADGAISEATFTVAADSPGVPTGPLGWIRRIYQRGYNRRTRNRNTGVVTIYAADNTTALLTYTQSTDGTTDTTTRAT